MGVNRMTIAPIALIKSPHSEIAADKDKQRARKSVEEVDPINKSITKWIIASVPRPVEERPSRYRSFSRSGLVRYSGCRDSWMGRI